MYTKHNTKLNLWCSHIRSFKIKDVETEKCKHVTLPDFKFFSLFLIIYTENIVFLKTRKRKISFK